MSVVETVRSRAEELRTKVQTRLAQGGILGGSSGGGILGSSQILKGPLVTSIREKGLIEGVRTRVAEFRAPPAKPAPPAPEVVAPSPVVEAPRVRTY